MQKYSKFFKKFDFSIKKIVKNSYQHLVASIDTVKYNARKRISLAIRLTEREVKIESELCVSEMPQ